MNIGIYLYADAEVLDFAGPYEVFATAGRLSPDRDIQVCLIGETGEMITARNGFRVVPDYGLNDHPPLDLMLVPGGIHTREMHNPKAIDWIKRQAQTVKLVTSVCTGAFLLAEAGLLTGRRATTHWEDMADLRQSYPDIAVIDNVRWVKDGTLITSGGIAAGIDMALYLVSQIADEALARQTARQMEYPWPPKST